MLTIPLKPIPMEMAWAMLAILVPADISNTCDTDTDGDGDANNVDNCIAVANPTQANADGDIFGDACDPCPADATNTCATPIAMMMAI
jgi:hypothetical protein